MRTRTLVPPLLALAALGGCSTSRVSRAPSGAPTSAPTGAPTSAVSNATSNAASNAASNATSNATSNALSNAATVAPLPAVEAPHRVELVGGARIDTGSTLDAPVRASSGPIDLSDLWAGGTGPEPTATSFTVSPPCNYSPGAWIIQQNGHSLSTWLTRPSWAQGIARKPESGPGENRGTGRISGTRVTIREDSVRYVLRYDRKTTHLRGTRNGKPFWAIRQRIQRPSGCIPLP